MRRGPLPEFLQETWLPVQNMVSESSWFLLQRSLASYWGWDEEGASTLSTSRKSLHPLCTGTFPVALHLIS